MVASGGTTADTVINGGLLDLAAGASTLGAITFRGSNGVLEIDGTTMPSGVISGFTVGDRLDLTAVPFSPLDGVQLLANNVLQVVEGRATYRFNLDPKQDFGGVEFHLVFDNRGHAEVLATGPGGVLPAGAAAVADTPSTALLTQQMASVFPSSGLAQSDATQAAWANTSSQAAPATLVHIRQ
jgi:hypothetical protein